MVLHYKSKSCWICYQIIDHVLSVFINKSQKSLDFGIVPSNSTINLAGNIKFNVIGNATNLNFFTTVEPRLNITASYESIPVGIATNVIFTVTSKGSPISAAT